MSMSMKKHQPGAAGWSRRYHECEYMESWHKCKYKYKYKYNEHKEEIAARPAARDAQPGAAGFDEPEEI